jgi:hypothetical protein
VHQSRIRWSTCVPTAYKVVCDFCKFENHCSMGRLFYTIFAETKPRSFETMVSIYQTTWCNILKDSHRHVESYLQAAWSTCTAGHNLCIVLYTIHPNSSHTVLCSPGHNTQNRFTANNRRQFFKLKPRDVFVTTSVTALPLWSSHCYQNSKSKLIR